MRKFVFIFSICWFAGSLSAQKLAGIVYDKVNQEPVPGAHVYLDGSSLGSVTDANGRYQISLNSIVNLPLVVNHISYQSKTISEPFTFLPDTIFLEEKENLLGEIVVQAGRYTRRQLLSAFRDVFLGTSQTAKYCVIENEDRIDLWFNERTRTLSANCDEPIVINNRSLAYNINISLEKFDVVYPTRRLGMGAPVLVDYKGSTIFEDISNNAKIVLERREKTFAGSPRHFLRALANNKLDDYNYLLAIKDDKWSKTPSECFTITVVKQNGQKQVAVNPLLKSNNLATYQDIPYYGSVVVQRDKEVTEIYFFQNNFTIDAWGTPTNEMLFVGYMGTLGFGDMMPADYGMDLSKPAPVVETVRNGNLSVEERLNKYAELLPIEKIYIHQDRTRYVAGETIWFKAYQTYSKGDDAGSSILYVDLINSDSKLAVSSKWLLEDNIAYGQIELPQTLPAGNYQLTAYTRWMQNEGMENYFTREIQVFSAVQAESADEHMPTREPSIELRFFPEGGNLVEGIPSKIAFKVTDGHGIGVNASGVITDLEGNEAQRFETHHNGMGVFMFTPASDTQYKAYLDNYPEENIFPAIQPKGIVMEVTLTPNWIHVTCRHNLMTPIFQAPFYLTIHQNGVEYYTTSVNVSNRQSVLHIPLDYLPEGIFTITVFDRQLNAWCERLAFFKYPESLQLQVTAEREKYEKRKEVTLHIQAKNSLGFPQSGNFSLAVVASGLVNPENRNNFYSDYFLQSEIRGIVENPASYFEEQDTVGLQKINLLLLTQGWRKYVWNAMMALAKPKIRYAVEKDLGFSGKVDMGKRTTKEQVDVTALLRLDELSEILSGRLEDDGSFQFSGYHFSDTAQVLISAVDNKKTALNLTVDKPVFPTPVFLHPKYDSLEQQFGKEQFGNMPVVSEDMEKRIYELPEIQVTARVNRLNRNERHSSEQNVFTYEVNKKNEYIGESAIETTGSNFIDSNNNVIDMTNTNVVGNTGALAILNQIPRMRMLRESGGGAAGANISSNVEPIYVLDGVRVTADKLRATPASMIARVELLDQTASMVYGSGSFGGAVVFYTKDMRNVKTSNPSSSSKTVSYRFAGYNQEKEFYTPDYSLPQTNFKPDFRKTLYWQPEVILDEEGKAVLTFFTSDEQGEYIIHCEGISDKKEIGVGQSRFGVY